MKIKKKMNFLETDESYAVVRSNGYGGEHELNIRPIGSIGQRRRLEGHAIDGVAGDLSFAVQQVSPPALHINVQNGNGLGKCKRAEMR